MKQALYLSCPWAEPSLASRLRLSSSPSLSTLSFCLASPQSAPHGVLPATPSPRGVGRGEETKRARHKRPPTRPGSTSLCDTPVRCVGARFGRVVFWYQQEAQLKDAMCTPCAGKRQNRQACTGKSQGLKDASRRLDIGSMAYMRQCSSYGRRKGGCLSTYVCAASPSCCCPRIYRGDCLGGEGRGASAPGRPRRLVCCSGGWS